ncbi:MAG: alpha-galactosidase [Anaerolineae bacterium]
MAEDKVGLGRHLLVDPAAGTIEIVHGKRVVLSGATASITYRRGDGRKVTLTLSDKELSYGLGEGRAGLSRRDQELELTWQLEAKEEGCEIWLEAVNLASEPLYIEELRPLSADAAAGSTLNLGIPPRLWCFYQNGWQSWSPTFARHVADGLFIDPSTDDYRLKHQPHPLPSRPKTMSSEWFSVICARPKGQKPKSTPDRSLLLGFVTTRDQLAEIRLQADKDQFYGLVATCHADGIPLPPGEKLTSERLLLRPGKDPFSLLDHYVTVVAERMGARCPQEMPTGWCTWYYFYGEDKAVDVLGNMSQIKGQQLPLDYILIDDGYQTAIGDWLTSDEKRYPQGMQWLAEVIMAAGHRPALWTAPFAASAESQLYAQHPDWVIKGEDGEPLVAWQHFGSDIYALDLSHPAVQEWLGDLFHTLSYEWNFELFKIDFLYAAALPGQRHDPTMTRAQALRRGLKIIRQAIGDRFLLACGAPLGPAIGLVDGMRIGPDVAVNWKPFWGDMSMAAAQNALRNVVTRHFMHGRLWANDPDCVLVRSRADECDLVLNEMRTLVSLIGLVGGLTLSSDNFNTIRPGRLKYLRQILPPYGKAARPLDLFENEMPSLLALPVERDFGRWLVAALINWSDHTVETRLDLSRLGLEPGREYRAYNYWQRHYLGVVRDQITIPRHQPHQTALLLFKEVAARPDLLTSTFHITQGGVEVRDVRWRGKRGRKGTLTVELEKRGRQFGRLLFSVPEPYRVARVTVNGRRRGVKEVEQGVVGLGFTLTGQGRVEIEFES